MNARSSSSGADSRPLYQRRELKALATRWDAKAANWDRELADPACHLNEDEGYSRFITEARAILEERRRFCAQHGVLDAGCGTGLVLAAVLPWFDWGLGVDISPEMVRTARAKNLPRAEFVIGDCFALASLGRPAGAVLSRGVLLSHYGRAAAPELLRSARATLVPGGFLLCDFLNAAGQSASLHAPKNKTYFAGQELLALAHEAGFARARLLGESHRRAQFVLAELS